MPATSVPWPHSLQLFADQHGSHAAVSTRAHSVSKKPVQSTWRGIMGLDTGPGTTPASGIVPECQASSVAETISDHKHVQRGTSGMPPGDMPAPQGDSVCHLAQEGEKEHRVSTPRRWHRGLPMQKQDHVLCGKMYFCCFIASATRWRALNLSQLFHSCDSHP